MSIFSWLFRSAAGTDSGVESVPRRLSEERLAKAAKAIAARLREAGSHKPRVKPETPGELDSGDVRYSLKRPDDPDIRRSRKPLDFDSACRKVQASVDVNQTLRNVLSVFVESKCGGRASVAYARAGISRQLYSQILSKEGKQVQKRTVMQLAIGLMLTAGEASYLMRAAGYSFSPSSLVDQVFLWCIENGAYNMLDVNELLVRNHVQPIALS